MLEKLNDDSLDQVSGGTVIISMDYGVVGFTSTGETYNLVNVDPRTASDFTLDLKAANPTMSNSQFDEYVKAEMQARGWI